MCLCGNIRYELFISHAFVLKLDYWGMFGNKKNTPYANLFNELNGFLNENFIILQQEIKEENSAKDKK